MSLITGQATGEGAAKGHLGQALGPYQVLGNNVYRRDLTRGIALCSPTGAAQTVSLATLYRRIRGSQDSNVNKGQMATSVKIGAGEPRGELRRRRPHPPAPRSLIV